MVNQVCMYANDRSWFNNRFLYGAHVFCSNAETSKYGAREVMGRADNLRKTGTSVFLRCNEKVILDHVFLKTFGLTPLGYTQKKWTDQTKFINIYLWEHSVRTSWPGKLTQLAYRIKEFVGEFLYGKSDKIRALDEITSTLLKEEHGDRYHCFDREERNQVEKEEARPLLQEMLMHYNDMVLDCHKRSRQAGLIGVNPTVVSPAAI